ncbi:MAG: ATP-binding protein [Patescibacteria group bacterium]
MGILFSLSRYNKATVLNATSAISWFSALIFGLFAVLLHVGSKKPSTRAYSILAFTCSLWSLSQGTFYWIATSSAFVGDTGELLLFFNRLNHFAAASVGPLFYYFGVLFPEEVAPPRKQLYWLMGAEVVLAYLYLGTNTIIHDLFIVSVDRLQYGWHLGSLGALFYAHFLIPFAAGIYLLWKKYRTASSPETKSVLRVLLWAIVWGALLAIVIAMVLPAFGYFHFARYAPFSALVWVALTYYTIVRYRALDVRHVVAEIAVFAMIVILFLNILFSGSGISGSFLGDVTLGLPTIEGIGASIAHFRASIVTPGIESMVNWLAGILFASFAIVLATGSRRSSNRAYALLATMLALWGFGMGLYYMLIDHDILLFLNRFNHYVGGAVGTIFLYFAMLYPSEEKPKRWVFPLLVSLEAILLPLYLFTPLIIRDTFIVLGNTVENGWQFGPLGFLFHLNFAPFFIGGLTLLWKKFRSLADPATRHQLFIIFAATLLGSLIGVTVAVVLPLFGLFRFSWLGPLFALSWVLLTSYVIVKYKALNLKLIAAELALLLMVIVLFVNIFLPFGIGDTLGSFAKEDLSSLFGPVTGYTMLNWTTALIFAIFGTLIYLGSKASVSRAYARIVWVAGLWAFGIGLYYAAGTDAFLTLIIRLNHFIGSGIALAFFAYTFSIPEGNRMPRKVALALLFLELIVGYLFIGTDLLVASAHLGSAGVLDRTWTYGPLRLFEEIHFIGFFVAAAYLLWKKLGYLVGENKKARLFILWGSLLGALPGLVIIYPLIEHGGNTSLYWFAPTAILGWIGFNSYAIKRYQFLSVRFIVTTLLAAVLILILFVNIFVSGMGAFLITTSLWANLNSYALINLATALTLFFFSFYLYRHSTREGAMRYSFLVFMAGAWALATSFLYASSTDASLLFWAKTASFVGNGVAVAFLFFALAAVERPLPRTKIASFIALLELGFGYLYYQGNLIIAGAGFGGPNVLDRYWTYGEFGLLARIHFLVLLTIGFAYMHQHLDKATILGPTERRKGVFWTALLGTIPVMVSLFYTYAGYTNTYWLGPIAMIGWLGMSAYAIAREEVIALKVITAELGIFFIVFLLFGNIFAHGELTSGFISKALIFTAFTTVGIFFIRNIIKGEEQKEELDRLSVTLSDLNKNLQAKVLERTREVEQSKTHIETVLENLTNGLVEYAGDGRIVRMNRAAERLLGIERESVIGRAIGVGDVRKPELEGLTLVTYPELSEKRASTGTPETDTAGNSSEVVVHHPEEREFQITKAEISSEGEAGTVRVIRDVTRENLIMRGKSEFISIAAHQLRSPLSYLRWTFESFLGGDYGELPPSLREALISGKEAEGRMNNLVNDLLTVARIEGGKFDFKSSSFELGELALERVHAFAQMAKERGVLLETRIPARKGYTVGDAEKAGIALDNLLSNAIWYTEQGGSVTVSLVAGREFVKVVVRDTGKGLVSEQKDRLFTKFFRSDAALRANPNGSGLGLFIVKNIMSYHKGTIALTSNPGKGTTATLSFPRMNTKNSSPEEASYTE